MTPGPDELIREVVWAVESELNRVPKHLDFKVIAKRREGAIWRVQVDVAFANTNTLDESLEGATAWWPEPVKGGADVLSVNPEREEINLRVGGEFSW